MQEHRVCLPKYGLPVSRIYRKSPINYELAAEDEPQNQEASETGEYSDDLLSVGIQDLLDTDDEPDDAFEDYDESMDDMDEFDDVE